MEANDPTRDAGLARLTEFVPQAGHGYAEGRNHDPGPDAPRAVSGLSPWIRHRLLEEREVLEAVLREHSPADAQSFVREVFWRGYFKGWLEHRPAVWADYVRERDRWLQRAQDDGALDRRYRDALAGRTGIECFDAWAAELVAHGYLHNHARMWFASIWIFTLELPWELGADFFLRHLLDGDAASNTCSWRWVGGRHTPGKTYLARASNIRRFTGGRFDPREQLASSAPAPADADLPPAEPLADDDPLDGIGDYALLVTDEDGRPESLSLPGPPALILGYSGADSRGSGGVSDAVRDFASGAVADAVRRAAEHHGVAASIAGSTRELVGTLGDAGLRSVVSACVPVGPVRDELDGVFRDVHWLQRRRAYDQAVWPHANRGFFRLARRIDDLLEELGLPT